jgi:hypothetical protein
MKNLLVLILMIISLNSFAQKSNQWQEDATQFYQLHLKTYLQGMYDSKLGLMKADTIKVELRNYGSPYEIVDESVAVANTSGYGIYNFSSIQNGMNYYIVVKHRNSLETWSSIPIKFTNNIGIYDMSLSNAKAFENNLVKIGTHYCLYSGDVNQDGIIDVTDVSLINNDILNFKSGYLNTDLNNDLKIDVSDLIIGYNNMIKFVSVKIPIQVDLKYPIRNPYPVLSDSDGDVLILPYTQLQKENDKYRMYYYGWGARRTALSFNGIDGWSDVRTVTGNAETIIIVNGKALNSGHRWITGTCYNYSSKSESNAYTFTDLPIPLFVAGEDRSMVQVGDSIYCYIRPNQRPFGLSNPRKIAMMTCSVNNFGVWTPMKDVLLTDGLDGNKQLYSMVVSKIDGEFYGLLNVMTMGANGLEGDYVVPPYEAGAFEVECQLAHSYDGRNWTRLNDRNKFLKSPTMKQVYGMSMVQIGEKVMIHSIETKRLHTSYDDEHKDGRYFGIYNYEFLVKDLKDFR